MSTENRYNFKCLNCFSSWEIVNSKTKIWVFWKINIQKSYWYVDTLFLLSSFLNFPRTFTYLENTFNNLKYSLIGKILQVHIKKNLKIKKLGNRNAENSWVLPQPLLIAKENETLINF